MIVGIEKIKGTEFNFPIANAQNAIYKVESVNILDTLGSTTGNWGAVVLAKFENKGTHYLVPQHVVFSIECDTKVIPTYKISAMTNDGYNGKMEVSRNGVKTPELFFTTLKMLAEAINQKM
ncbi:MAG: hypothetical protein RLZZ196_1359 [Bacteroidota bacterium]|jgi:hypothetical protein